LTLEEDFMMQLSLYFLLSIACVGSLATCKQEEPEPTQPPVDRLAPIETGEDAPTLQLHTVTLCTADLEAAFRLYRDGLGLEVRGPVEMSGEATEIQRALWGIPDAVGWDLYVLERPTVPGTVQIRLLHLSEETPRILKSWNPLEPGPFSMGFPTEDAEGWDLALRELGFDSLAPIEKYEVPSPDGQKYGIHETIFNGPDFVHAVTISRKDGMPQLGPVDPTTGWGGPVYSAQSITDSDDVLHFYTDVLGLELRSDQEWITGETSALGVPPGLPFRFSLVYARGARFGHLLFIDFRENAEKTSGVPPRPPNQGLTMWSFPVRDIEAMLKRVQEAEVPVIGGPESYESPELGKHRALTVLAPNGFLVELFQPIDGQVEE
jgi:catechol 2,3-dioxygenase-like lactoylglutathione lyase family enzyme